MSAADVIIAFSEFYGSRRSFISMCKHGGTPGYVHIVPAGFDPTKAKDRHVAVELYNGTVCVSDFLNDALNAHSRPKDVRIEIDPLGYSAGPKYGRFAWGFTVAQIDVRKDGLRGLVKDVAHRLDEGREPDGVVGDYDED